jgi:excisionase family DNA binding protein
LDSTVRQDSFCLSEADVISIDQLSEHPERVSEIPPREIPGLVARLSALLVALVARGSSTPPADPEVPQGVPKKSQDRNLTVHEAAKLMGVKPSWLYRHSGKLPFTRRLSRRALRFSEKGLRRWLETRS